jgi:glutamate/tyrosine decarboxylase-like PLP-dependent enzyme
MYKDWPGGTYGSLAMAGARPAAPVAAAWAVMNFLGVDGYVRLTTQTIETVRRIREGVEELGLQMVGDPVASVLAFTSPNIMAIGDQMDDKGWHLDRQHEPDALHLMVSPAHHRVVDAFLFDLREAVANAGASRGVEARYS